MLHDSPSSAAGPDLRPHTERFPTQFRRGYYAFKQVPPPPPVITPLPSRWITLRDVVALRIRMAGQLVPHRVQGSADQGELEAFPRMNVQGAQMDFHLLDTLYFFATPEKQNTGTPRTGGSTLARAMAPKRKWPLTKTIDDPDAGEGAVKEVPRTDSELIDSYKGGIADARWRCVQMGLLGHVRTAWDSREQERGTDWELLEVPEISEAEYEAADAAIAKYVAKHPPEKARPLSAAVRGRETWHFKRRVRLRLKAAVYERTHRRKNKTAPLPAAGHNPKSLRPTDNSYRAGPSNPGMTRDLAMAPPAPSPRTFAAGDKISGGAGSVSAKSSAAVLPTPLEDGVVGWRDGQQRRDVGAGRFVALQVAEQLGWKKQDRSAISAKAADKLGRLARRAEQLLGLSGEDLAAVLVQKMARHDCHLGEAIRIMRRDLKRHPESPIAQRTAARRELADRLRAAELAATPLPDFVRTDAHGLPRLWVDAEGGGNPHLACTTLPHDLSDPQIRKAIHAAAHAARITGPQRVVRAAVTPNSPLDPRLFTLHERLDATERLRGNGCVRLIALTGEIAIVPPEHSTAPARRWTIERTPSPEQIQTYQLLLKRRTRRRGATDLAPTSNHLGRQHSAEPATFVEMWWAIDALIAELAPDAHQPNRDPGPTQPTPAAGDDSQQQTEAAPINRATIDRGLALIAEHGTIAAAIMATHPDHDGTADDLQAVLAARSHYTGTGS